VPETLNFLAIFEFARVFCYKIKQRGIGILINSMFALLFDLEDYATTYRATRDAYLKAANGA
jgi:short-subunit dehydrogenase